MQRGFISSIILHTVLLLLLVFGFPWFFHKEIPQESVISVEMVPISELSNIKPKKAAPAEKKPEPSKPPTPSKPAAAPEPKPEPKPELKPEPKPEPKKPELKPEPKKPEPKPKEKEKPKEKPKKKKNENNLDSLLKNLEDNVASKEKSEKKKKEKEAEEEESKDADTDSQSDKPFNDAAPLSLSQQDFIRSQVEKHWSPPAGAKDAGQFSVKLRVSLAEDGTVTQVKIVEPSSSLGADAAFARSFDESAVRAVRMSSPFHDLPADKYDSWKDFTFTFTPENLN